MDNVDKTQQAQDIIRQQITTQQITSQQIRGLIKQQTSARSLKAFLDQEVGTEIISIKKFSKTLEEQRLGRKALMKASADEEVEIVEEIKQAEETATRFNKKNFELKTKTLLILRDSISDDDTVEDILRKVLDFYPDYTLADDALDFLLQTTKGPLAIKVQMAKDSLNDNFKREIIAGRNINFQAQTFSKTGLGTPTALRDMYRDITGNPRTPHTLFDELSTKFSYDSMRVVIRFLLHSLGADLKSKGPSITRPELIRLIEDTQLLQAISGVYRFFISRQRLMDSQFEHYGLILPKNLNFETLSKIFITLLKERYVTSEKILLLSRKLGISQELAAQIIIYSQMRDAVRQTSGRLYKSEKYRQDVLAAFIEALEELEEELEEEEEK
jgi:type III secretion protein W